MPYRRYFSLAFFTLLLAGGSASLWGEETPSKPPLIHKDSIINQVQESTISIKRLKKPSVSEKKLPKGQTADEIMQKKKKKTDLTWWQGVQFICVCILLTWSVNALGGPKQEKGSIKKAPK